MGKNYCRGLLCVLGCMAGTDVAAEIRVQSPVPYSDMAVVADNIRQECRIGVQLAEALRDAAASTGNNVLLVADASDAGGQVLKLEIADAESAGNAFTGHHKSVSVRGYLLSDGVKGPAFVARRFSRGGVMGGFKGSCAVLERTVGAIGGDVAEWLANPVDGAKLGNL